MARKHIHLTGLPMRRTMRHQEAVAFLGGEQAVRDARTAGILTPCAEPTRRQTFYRTADVVAVEDAILAGQYPNKPAKP